MQIHINIIEANFLKLVSFPYIELSIEDHLEKSEIISSEKTMTCENTNNPIWNQKFVFNIRSIESNIIHIHIKNMDGDESISEFWYDLESLNYGVIIDNVEKF